MAGLTQRVEAILLGDAHDGLTYRLAGATETLAEVARNLPPPGANVRHEGGAARLDAVFEVVYVRGDPWVALPAARIARIPGGYPEGVLGRIDSALGSRLASAVTEASVLILYVDAERRARALVGLFTHKDQYYHGALALAVVRALGRLHLPHRQARLRLRRCYARGGRRARGRTGTGLPRRWHRHLQPRVRARDP
jgi:hypothetical protein